MPELLQRRKTFQTGIFFVRRQDWGMFQTGTCPSAAIAPATLSREMTRAHIEAALLVTPPLQCAIVHDAAADILFSACNTAAGGRATPQFVRLPPCGQAMIVSCMQRSRTAELLGIVMLPD